MSPAVLVSDRVPRSLAHAERVTISAEGRASSNDLEPAVTGHVLSYRALRRRAMASLASGAASAPSAFPPEKMRNAHSGVKAYLRTMERNAA